MPGAHHRVNVNGLGRRRVVRYFGEGYKVTIVPLSGCFDEFLGALARWGRGIGGLPSAAKTERTAGAVGVYVRGLPALGTGPGFVLVNAFECVLDGVECGRDFGGGGDFVHAGEVVQFGEDSLAFAGDSAAVVVVDIFAEDRTEYGVGAVVGGN